MVGYNVDILLGPGMNIHRHPLCGRNFEYFSEDPMLTGLMGAAVVNGLQSAGVTGTIKHIALNNQEYRRFDADSIASERAIREIYLKGFEIAVKKAKARAIMTSYNPINGIWAAGNFDLIARVIRHEWQFKGIVMTDWWAKMNDDQDEGSRTNIKSMIKAQGDLYMVVVDAKGNSLGDNFMQAIEENKMTKGEAQEVAKNIISFILQSSRYQHMMGQKVEQKPNLFPLPVLKKVFVNGIELESFDERKTHYELETYDHFNLTFELEANTSYHVKRNAHTTTVSLINHQAQNQYIFTNRKRHIHRESFQLEDIHTDHPLAISDVAWGKTGLNLIEPTWHNRFIEFKDGYVSMMKNGLISFAIEIKTYGKYIVELSIASDASELSQLPFSILAEDVVLSTLTTKGTGGKWFDIASQVVLTEGIKRLTFKAHASGLNIKRIELIKHQ
jgi:beta-glucosidase